MNAFYFHSNIKAYKDSLLPLVLPTLECTWGPDNEICAGQRCSACKSLLAFWKFSF